MKSMSADSRETAAVTISLGDGRQVVVEAIVVNDYASAFVQPVPPAPPRPKGIWAMEVDGSDSSLVLVAKAIVQPVPPSP